MIERYRAHGGGQIIVLDAVVVGLHLTRRSFRRFELTPQELARGVDRFDAPPLGPHKRIARYSTFRYHSDVNAYHRKTLSRGCVPEMRPAVSIAAQAAGKSFNAYFANRTSPRPIRAHLSGAVGRSGPNAEPLRSASTSRADPHASHAYSTDKEPHQ